MADRNITNNTTFPIATEFNLADLILVLQNGVLKKVPKELLYQASGDVSIIGEKHDFTLIDNADAAPSVGVNKTIPVAKRLDAVAKKGFLTFRIDNPTITTTPVSEAAAILEKFNYRFVISENFALLHANPVKLAVLKDLQRRGHVLLDHTPNHNADFFHIPPGYRTLFDTFVGNGLDYIIDGVGDELDSAILTRSYPGISSYTEAKIGETDGYVITAGTSRITGDFSMLDITSGVYYSYYVYVDNLIGDKIGWQPIAQNYLVPGYIDIMLPTRDPIIFEATETISLYAVKYGVEGVTLGDDASYVLLLASQIWANYLGFEKPLIWVHPGGMWSTLNNNSLEYAMGKLGLVFADTADATTVTLTYCSNRENPNSAHTWGGWDLQIDASDGDLDPVKEQIAEAIAKNTHRTIGGHLYYTQQTGATDEAKKQSFLKFIYDLMQWCSENEIVIVPYTEAIMVLQARTDRYANIMPNLYTDLAVQSKPDGYTLGESAVWVTDDGRPEDNSHSLKLNGNGTIFSISSLGGIEKGENTFECWIKGTSGAIITIAFGALGNAVFTLTTTATWQKFTLAASTGITLLDVPFTTDYLSITATASNNSGTDISISGMKLRGN